MDVRVVFILSSLFLLCSNGRFAAAMSSGNETDRMALLAFKDRLADPTGALSSWNDSAHFCQWEGVSCSRKHRERVTALDLTSRSLSGPISPSIANLTFLQTINFGFNGFYGEIPPEFGQLRRLQLLNLSFNSFHGALPVNLTYCSELRSLSLYANQLTGRIPDELGSLSKLDTLNLGNNSISGLIPPSFWNLTSLARVTLAVNHLVGRIPEELGQLKSLGFFQVGVNMLSGELPPSFYNLSSLYYIGVAFNGLLNGSLPPNFGITFPNLQSLLLAGNQFHGPIPASVTNMTSLVEFNIAYNNFSGRVPFDLGRLQRLRYVNLGVNQFEANDVDDWKFIDSLSNCSGLQRLILSDNKFGGILPPSVANLSTQLQKLEMSNNHISGSIPSEIGNLVNLNTLQIQDNLFTSTIPESIGKLKSLYRLALFGNRLRGKIPSSLGNLTQLLDFRLDGNHLEGSIPPSLGNLQNLVEFDLSINSLSGTIPKEIFSLSYLSNYMDLSYNQLDGSLPVEVGNLKSVRSLLLRANKLSGEIPSTLGNCESLEYLGMNHNFFDGTIPQSLGNIRALKGLNLSENNLSGSIPLSFSKLKGLQELYLSYNNLSGPIPQFLENLTFLFHLNLSFNHFQGEVPINGVFRNATAISILGNDGLCGGISQLHLSACPPLVTSTKRRGWSLMLKKVVISAAVIMCLLLFTSFVYVCWKRKSRKKTSSLPFFEDQFQKVSYRELVKVTDGFSSRNLIGRGMYGLVYKGSFDGGDTFVAVKVFNLQEQGASKSFIAECEALRSIRHRNLIKILTSCSSVDYKGNDFKALVFEFMPNGNLDTWLHPGEALNDQANSTLSLIQRLNIAIDVANALEYLHHNCQPPVVHCDLKPSNVLLDKDMGARVGDFGLAKFRSEVVSKSFNDSSSSIGIRGTVGYVAPEYGAGGQVSTSGDVYSFGILLLELFTGKRPIDNMFEDGLNLCKFVEMGASHDQVMEIADPLMLSQDQLATGGDGIQSNTAAERIQECLVSVMSMGLLCSNQLPGERMHIRDAVAELHSIRKAYLGGGHH